MDRVGYPLVRVVWVDAESSDQWACIEKEKANTCATITTVGHLLSDQEEHIIIAMNLDTKNQSVSMVMTLPNHWVESVDVLHY